MVSGSVQVCKLSGVSDREEIRVKIAATNVLVFGKVRLQSFCYLQLHSVVRGGLDT